MTLLLGKNKKINLKKPDEPAKWYAYAKTRGTISEQEIARQVAEGTIVNCKQKATSLRTTSHFVARHGNIRQIECNSCIYRNIILCLINTCR